MSQEFPMKLVNLVTRPLEVQTSVVDRLEAALALAKSGELTAVAIAAVENGGGMLRWWSDSDAAGHLIGSVARLQHSLNLEMDGNVEEV